MIYQPQHVTCWWYILIWDHRVIFGGLTESVFTNVNPWKGFQSHGGTPSYHSILEMDVPWNKPSSYRSIPMDYWKPQYVWGGWFYEPHPTKPYQTQIQDPGDPGDPGDCRFWYKVFVLAIHFCVPQFWRHTVWVEITQSQSPRNGSSETTCFLWFFPHVTWPCYPNFRTHPYAQTFMVCWKISKISRSISQL